MLHELTDIEQKVLEFMVAYLRSNTYQPSVREIGERFGIRSTKTVSELLQSLADKGYVERDASRSRGVKILGMAMGAEVASVPIVPLARAGKAAVSRDGGERIAIDRRTLRSARAFGVRVDAAAARAAGFASGTVLVIEPRPVADVPDGSLVLVRLGGSAPRVQRLVRSVSGTSLAEPVGGGAAVHVEDPSSIDLVGQVVAWVARLAESPSPEVPTAH